MTPAIEALSAEQLMARAGKTFYRAARLLPKSVRGEVICLYAFCRQVDDLADEPGRPTLQRSHALRALAAAFEQANISELRAASWPFAAQGTMGEAARLLVLAAAQELQQQQPRTERDLLAYAFGVAGTVGIMMAYVLRAESAGLRAAVALGMGMQLSNIARDVSEDLQRGRIYLPSQWIAAPVLRGFLQSADPACARNVLTATGRLVGLAEVLYETAFDGIWSLPWRVRWSVLAAALCYREIGREVRRQGSHSWRRRVVISGRRKLWLITLAGLRLLLPRFWLPHRHATAFSPGQAMQSTAGLLGLI